MPTPALSQANQDRYGERYEALLQVNDVISQYRDLDQLFKHLADCLRPIVPFDVIAVGLYDREKDLMRITLLDARVATPLQVGTTVSPDDVPGRAVMDTQRHAMVRVDDDHSPYKFHQQMMRLAGAKVSYHLPLSTSVKRLGVLALGSTIEITLSHDELEFLQRVANQVAIVIENALAYQEIASLKEQLAQEKLYLEDEIRSEINFGEIVGESASLKAALQRVGTVAASDATVLILGETGTGKELIARAIHEASRRKGRTFVKLNCAAIPTGLLESEIFGHERGAFTGAIAQKIGRMELANGGTLFLDEVGDIPLELQPKLLRALQEREFERLGSTRTQKSDVRFIAATNRDLPGMVAAKEFRSDLFYRINVFPISVPPLRERQGDIPRLVRYFVSKYSKKMDKKIDNIPVAAMNKLQQWRWPGNVRELENFIERSVILTTGSVLHVPLAELESSEPLEAPQTSLRHNEREHIMKVLKETNWVLSGPNGAAARLGLKRTTLQYKMKKLNLSRGN